MEKLELLIKELKSYKKVVVAFSGGVDSSLLLMAARQALGADSVMAVTAKGVMTSSSNYEDLLCLVKEMGVACLTIEVDHFQIPEVMHNQKNRCYACKRMIFEKIIEVGTPLGYEVYLEGSNLDDDSHYRPGKKAMEELGVLSPLKICGFTKKEVREAARALKLPVWNKPSDSCLATRFPYDTILTKEMFQMIERAEKLVKSLGITTCRVRTYGWETQAPLSCLTARIEVEKKEFEILAGAGEMVQEIKKLGFRYVTIDLEGFRSGSLDE